MKSTANKTQPASAKIPGGFRLALPALTAFAIASLAAPFASAQVPAPDPTAFGVTWLNTVHPAIDGTTLVAPFPFHRDATDAGAWENAAAFRITNNGTLDLTTPGVWVSNTVPRSTGIYSPTVLIGVGGGTVVVGSGNLIWGKDSAILMNDDDAGDIGTVTNSGTLWGESQGVWHNSAGTPGTMNVTNNTGGYIGGGLSGVSLLRGGEVSNAGKIQGLDSSGVTTGASASTLVTNKAGGYIVGANRGVNLNGNDTVRNSGSISGDVGIYAASNLVTIAISNSTGALINGMTAGVRFNADAGTIENFGTIRAIGDTADAQGIYINDNSTVQITNRAGGLIEGGLASDGIEFKNNNSTLQNSGTVKGGSTGIYIHGVSAVTITNDAGALIEAAGGANSDSIRTSTGGTVDNAGTIRGARHGLFVTAGSALVTNRAGGLIQGTADAAIQFHAGGTVANSGTIKGIIGIFERYAASAVSNDATGLIEGDSYGVNMLYGGSLANAGAIAANDANGVGVVLDSGAQMTNTGLVTGGVGAAAVGVRVLNTSTLTNSGTIDGGAGTGVTLGNASSTLISLAGSKITGARAIAFIGPIASGTYTNDIFLESTGTHGFEYTHDVLHFINTTTGTLIGAMDGLKLTAGGRVDNDGLIRGDGGIGAGIFNVSGTVNNAGGALIAGRNVGLYLNAGGTVANSGTITGGNWHGLSTDSIPTTVTNNTGGLIEGKVHGIYFQQGGTLTNLGDIRATEDAGVRALMAPSYVDNRKLISGGTTGVILDVGGTIINSGTILGLNPAGGVGIYANGRTAITNTGLVEGGHIGASFGSGAAGSTLLNTGTIRAMLGSDGMVSAATVLVTNNTGGLFEGTDKGVWLQGGGTVANFAAIVGGTTGVRLEQGGEVRNAGTITGTGLFGVIAYNLPALISNTNTGVITGGQDGVTLLGGGTVANAGVITGTGLNGISAANAPVHIANANTGVISGEATGVNIHGGGTVANAGTITGTTDYGVIAGTAPVLIDNTDTGAITGGQFGIMLGAGGTITNAGTITGTSANSEGIYATGYTRVDNTAAAAIIQGDDYGIRMTAGGTILNNGSILADGHGINTITNPVDITNNAGALIQGGDFGITLNAGGVVTNSGTINQTSSVLNTSGITANATTLVTNNASGLISGYSQGAILNAGGTVNNAGTITGTAGAMSQGVNITGGVVNNTSNTALIEGSFAGVFLVNGGTATNAGIIRGIAGAGVQAYGGYVSIGNAGSGLIEGTDYGMYLANGGSVANSGTIRATTAAPGVSYAIWTDESAIINNNAPAALIEAVTTAIELVRGGTVNNTGTIKGDTSTGIYVGGLAQINNTAATALISGGTYGVHITQGGTINNAGTIEGTGAASAGIYAVGMPPLQINNTAATALIKGQSYGLQLNASATITNSGSIIGVTGHGILTSTPAHLTNNTGALIAGESAGATVSNNSIVVNSGTIANTGNMIDTAGLNIADTTLVTNNAEGVISGFSRGVHVAFGGTINNAGLITGRDTASRGINANGPATINNTAANALISGGQFGVRLAAGGTITNSGSIKGGFSSVEAAQTGGATHLVNNATGVLAGNVSLDVNAANRVDLYIGSRVIGHLAISNIAGNASALNLLGATGTHFYTDAVSGQTTFTGTLFKKETGTWVMDKDMFMARTRVEAGRLIVDTRASTLNSLNNGSLEILAGAVTQYDFYNTGAFANPLTGAGYLDMTNSSLDVSSTLSITQPAVGSAFSGTIGIRGIAHKAIFNFNQAADDALTSAVLRLGAKSETTLDTDRLIFGLDLAGGVFHVKAHGSSATAGAAPYKLTVKNFTLDTSSTLGVDVTVLSGITPPTGGLNGNIFDVDATTTGTPTHVVVDATAAGATAGQSIALINSANNAALGASSTITFTNATGGNPVGNAYYGHHAVVNAAGDLELAYGLTEIRSTHATEAVVIDPTGSFDKTLSSLLSGGGAGFTFIGNDTITLGRRATYTGLTTIDTGIKLVAGDTDIIATSTAVTINTGAIFSLNNLNQRLNNVSGAGEIYLGTGTLTVANTAPGLTYSGGIRDSGRVVLASGDWILTGSNTYTGGTELQTHTQLILGNGGATGSISNTGGVLNSGTFTINRSDNYYNYAGAITGSGVFIQRGSGVTLLTGANKIDGGIVVEQGALGIGDGGGAGNGWVGNTIDANINIISGMASIHRSDLVIYNGVIKGAGGFWAIGGTLALTKVQEHTGPMRAVGGTIRADIPDAIQHSSLLLIQSGGAFDLNNRKQTLKNLQGDGGAHLRYSTPNGVATTFATLTVTGSLFGETTHHMNVDLVNAGYDKLAVNGVATGTHAVVFNPVNPAPLHDPLRTYAIKVIDYASGDAVFSSNEFEGGMHRYKLYKGDGGGIMPDTTAYYLSGGDAFSRAGDAILFTAGVLGTDWHYELDNVSKRMGDIRASAPRDTGSVWMRANTYNLNAGAGLGGSEFDQNTYALSAGADKLWRIDDTQSVATGGFIGVSHSSRDFSDSRHHYGDGSTDGLTLGAYGLWMHDDGWFADGTLKLDRYNNELNARGVDGFVSSGEYSNTAFGLSIEAGRRFAKQQFWFEPAVQAAVVWIDGADYTVSNGVSRNLRINTANSTAWQYRAQLRAGANFGPWLPSIKFAAAKSETASGQVTVDGRRYQPWFDGGRFEAGAGVGYIIDAQSQVYLDYEYNKAEHYERPWSFNLGYRRAW